MRKPAYHELGGFGLKSMLSFKSLNKGVFGLISYEEMNRDPFTFSRMVKSPVTQALSSDEESDDDNYEESDEESDDYNDYSKFTTKFRNAEATGLNRGGLEAWAQLSTQGRIKGTSNRYNHPYVATLGDKNDVDLRANGCHHAIYYKAPFALYHSNGGDKLILAAVVMNPRLKRLLTRELDFRREQGQISEAVCSLRKSLIRTYQEMGHIPSSTQNNNLPLEECNALMTTLLLEQSIEYSKNKPGDSPFKLLINNLGGKENFKTFLLGHRFCYFQPWIEKQMSGYRLALSLVKVAALAETCIPLIKTPKRLQEKTEDLRDAKRSLENSLIPMTDNKEAFFTVLHLLGSVNFCIEQSAAYATNQAAAYATNQAAAYATNQSSPVIVAKVETYINRLRGRDTEKVEAVEKALANFRQGPSQARKDSLITALEIPSKLSRLNRVLFFSAENSANVIHFINEEWASSSRPNKP
jgi:hypothetical protein